MIDSKLFLDELVKRDIKFFTGVPDSLLKDFCACVTESCGEDNHVIAANEGGAVSLAAGYHLATQRIPLVYLQNSGLGNAINPLLSLCDKEVYSIPMILLIGWRGEPNVKDEPQHIKQGRVQNDLLKAMEIPYKVLHADIESIETFVDEVIELINTHKRPVAIVAKKKTFAPYKPKLQSNSGYELNREEAIDTILNSLPAETLFVSTTGKASRELFELRVSKNQGNQNDFLTVGSMGHCSQIALGVALNTSKMVVCIDGDGAALMHMGSMAVIGEKKPKNLLHVVINNGAHESVGGQPTVGFSIDFKAIALSCGYEKGFSVTNKDDLNRVLTENANNGTTFIEVRVKQGSRADLGRPTKTPIENKEAFMKSLKTKK